MDGFAHDFKHAIADMLRCDFHAPADMKPAQLFQKGVGAIVPKQIMAKSAADKSVVDAGKRPDTTV